MGRAATKGSGQRRLEKKKRDRKNKGRLMQATDTDETGQEVGKNELLREE